MRNDLSEKIKLEEGKEYRIELYPKKDIVNARFYKKIGHYYMFVGDDKSGNCAVHSNFIEINMEGIITHSFVSSAPIQYGDFSEGQLKKFVGLKE